MEGDVSGKPIVGGASSEEAHCGGGMRRLRRQGVEMSRRECCFSLMEGMRGWLEMISLKYLTLAHDILVPKLTKAIAFGLVSGRDLTQDGDCLGL